MSASVKEYRWALIVSILLLAFGSIPIIAGYAAQTPDQRFIGTFYDEPDYAVHMGMLHYGEQGGWDYQLRFTAEPHTTAYVRLFYVLLGHLLGWVHLPATILFQIARLGFGLLACLSIYRLLVRIFPSVHQRRLAFLLTLLGSGVGWLQVLFAWVPTKIAPVDLWLIDAYPLFSINLFPHFAATIAALAIAITAFLDHSIHPRWQNLAVIMACAIFVQIVNPIAFILADVAMVAIFAFASWQKRSIHIPLALSLGLIAVIQIPLLLYSLTLLTRDPAWIIYTRQDATPSPPPLYYLLGFALFWPFAIAGALKAFRQKDTGLGWAVAWTICAFGLAYAPVNIQSRFLLAITLPLAVLATLPLLDFSHWLSRKLRLGMYTGAVLITALASMSTLLLVGTSSMGMAARPPALFQPTELVQAVDWLGMNGGSNDVVLASQPTSLLVAIRTPLRLYSGHVMETLNYAEKSQAVQRFYQGEQPAGWPETQGITWVIFGPYEEDWQPALLDSSRLEVAYRNSQVTVFRVAYP